MTTAIQAVAAASLSSRQINSLTALQRNLDHRSYAGSVRVSEAQFKAISTAWNAVKASGLPVPPEMAKTAKSLGLE